LELYIRYKYLFFVLACGTQRLWPLQVT